MDWNPLLLFSILPMILIGFIDIIYDRDYVLILLTIGFLSLLKEALQQCHDNPIVVCSASEV